MRKFAEPLTVIPRAVSAETRDKRGRPVWEMPKTETYVEHIKWRKHKKTGKRIAEPIMVPVYRGYPASLLRHARAQFKRAMRKQAEAAALQAEQDAAEVDTEEVEKEDA